MRSLSLAQGDIFDYLPNDIQSIGDLQRLNVVLKEIPYQKLLLKLNAERKNGRDDYPNQEMFFILVAQFLFGRLQSAAMRRELSGNPSLRWLVGISDAENTSLERHLVPPEATFSLFMDRLIAHQADLDEIVADLRKRVYDEIPGVGVKLAGDGKYFDSYTPNAHSGVVSDTRRAEHDATYSKKSYTYRTDAGERHTKSETHYGFRKHTIVDATTELPIASVLTVANEDEKKIMTELIRGLPSYVMKRAKYMSFDRGYDSGDFIGFIRSYDVVPIIDKRMMRKGDPLRQYKDKNAFYTDAGDVYYIDEYASSDINPETGYPGCYVRAQYLGYDKSRGTIRYRCGNHVVRIYVKDDPRTFNEVARDSRKFELEYNRRTSVERYHARLDCDFGFETHTIRGIGKMRVMTTMADIVMLATALAHKDLGQNKYASIFDFGFVR